MGPHKVLFFLLLLTVTSLTWAKISSNTAKNYEGSKVPLGFSSHVESKPNEVPKGTGLKPICRSCCKKIEITSSGDASNYWPDTLGEYVLLGSHNGKNSFSHQENSNQLYWNDDDFWAVGESYAEAKLFSTADSNCPQDTNPWYYFSNQGTWLEDSSLNVQCVEHADCCEEIVLTASGGSADLWGDTQGAYTIMDEQHNGKNQFKHKANLNKIYWNDDNYWAISDSYSEAKMFSTANADCPDGTFPWYYFSDGSWLEDATVNIGCGGVHECCNVIEIFRSSEYWGDTVGEYTRMPTQHNGKVQFQHVSTVNLFYWNVNDAGSYWSVGEDYVYAKLYSLDDTTCPIDASSWMYYDGEGTWFDDDTMEVFCKDDTTVPNDSTLSTIGPNHPTTTGHDADSTTGSPDDCCNTVEITRSSEYWGDTVGEYTKLLSQHNGKSQFLQVSTVNLLYWNVADWGSYWAVGTDYEYAKLYSADDTTCPTDASYWMYFDDGLWYDDNTMEIFCKDGTTVPHESTTTGHHGDCPTGWIDGSSVGMGCLYVDVDSGGHHNVSDAQAACERVQPTSHLVEIFNDQQMTFLTELLADIEQALGSDDSVFWWLSLRTEVVGSGIWTWPFSGQQAEYTYWSDGEPLPEQDYNCAQMLSALRNEGKWWAARCFDDYPDELHVCQML